MLRSFSDISEFVLIGQGRSYIELFCMMKVFALVKLGKKTSPAGSTWALTTPTWAWSRTATCPV